jgi:hypothetical protein
MSAYISPKNADNRGTKIQRSVRPSSTRGVTRQGADSNEALNVGGVHRVSDVGHTYRVHRGRLPPVGADRRKHCIDAAEQAVKRGPIQHIRLHHPEAGAGRVDGGRVAGNCRDVMASLQCPGNELPARRASAPEDRQAHVGLRPV